MKYTILISLLISTTLNVSCQNQKANNSKQFLISNLEKAKNSKDINLIESLYTENAIIYTPDLMPVSGSESVVSIYKFIFSKGNIEFVKYVADSAFDEQNNHIEFGINITKKIGQTADTNEFKAVFQQYGKEYKIAEISFGKEENIKREVPELPKPTGKYKIGQATYFYNKTKSGNILEYYLFQTKSFQFCYIIMDMVVLLLFIKLFLKI